MSFTVQDVLARVKGAKRSQHGWMARCPAHDDDKASLSIGSGDNGKAILKCFAGCEYTAIVAALGIPARTRSESTAPTVYAYTDESGTVLYESLRYEPKDFKQRRPDGKGAYVWKLGDVRRVPYNLPALRKGAETGAIVYIVEGEKDVATLASLGVVATTIAGGAGGAKGRLPDDFGSHFAGAKSIVLLPDNDEPGRQYSRQLAELLSNAGLPCKIVELPGLGPKGDITDWVCTGGTLPQLTALVKAAPRFSATSPIASPAAVNADNTPVELSESLGLMHIEAFADIPLRNVEWLWRGYLPAGKIVVLDGFPGQGKSTAALDIAARLSRGHAMPDGSGAGEPADTLILTYEDDASDTLRPRLEAAGGDAHRVHHVAGVSYNGDELLMPPSLPKDLVLLEDVLKARPEIRLVVIDPLSAALGGEVDSHKDQSVRTVLARIARMASESSACFLIVRHVRKAPGSNAITAGGGSIGISGQARVVLLIDRAPDATDEDGSRAVLAVSKSNCGPIPPSLNFRKTSATITDSEGRDVETSRLEWTGIASMTADELLSARDDSAAGNGVEVADWLREVLGSSVGTDRKAVMHAAKNNGFSERTVERTAKRIGVVKEQAGFGTDRHSNWRLPSVIPATRLIPDQSRHITDTQNAVGNGENDGNGELLPISAIGLVAGSQPGEGGSRPTFGCSTCSRVFQEDPRFSDNQNDLLMPGDDRCFFCRREGIKQVLGRDEGEVSDAA